MMKPTITRAFIHARVYDGMTAVTIWQRPVFKWMGHVPL